jgi:hypothetical protein
MNSEPPLFAFPLLRYNILLCTYVGTTAKRERGEEKENLSLIILMERRRKGTQRIHFGFEL